MVNLSRVPRQADTVVTRFAPSPTGNLHVGSVRAALFSYLYARQHGGIFVLRIEDTDKARSNSEYEKDILDGLAWLGLSHDEFYRQSERLEAHRTYLKQLIEQDKAYVSDEGAPTEEGKRSSVIRFRNAGQVVSFTDLVRGTVTFDTTELGDFVIAKDLDTPLFHLSVVCDDYDMGISHVIRGEDHISNTPRQILIQDALGAPRPSYAHLPLVLGPDRSKLSKRHGALSVNEYRRQGFLPEALLNFLALIGWNPGSNEEILSIDDLIRLFDLEKVQKGGAVFNTDKLNWINKQHIEQLTEDQKFIMAKEYLSEKTANMDQYSDDKLKKALPSMFERIATFGDFHNDGEQGEYDYFFETPNYEATILLPKKNPDVEATIRHLTYLLEKLKERIGENISGPEEVKQYIWEYADTEGRGAVLWPLRVALTGRERSVDPFTTTYIIGYEEAVQRLTAAVEKAKELL